MGREPSITSGLSKSVIAWVITCWLSLFAISPAHSLTHLIETEDITATEHCDLCCQYSQFNAYLPARMATIQVSQQSVQLVVPCSFIITDTLSSPYQSRAPPFSPRFQ